MTSSSPLAFITGASSGIGYATALQLAKAGYRLLLTARRQERLESLQQACSEMSGRAHSDFRFFAADITDLKAIEKHWNEMPEEWKAIDLLVNNAGNAHGLSPAQSSDWQDWQTMIDLNVKSLMFLTHLVIPTMCQRKKGHIVNISSIAGRQAYANGAGYCASKAGVDAFTNGLRIDLNPFGIKVTAIAPGMVETEFSLVRFKQDAAKASAVYQGVNPLTADDIANTITWVATQPPHVQIADILILPTDQASATVVNRK